MSKRFVAVIGGYPRHEVYESLERHMDEHNEPVGTETDEGMHFYPCNSEGYQMWVVSNFPIPDIDLVDITLEGDEVDGRRYNEGRTKAGGELHDPVEITVDSGNKYWYIGGLLGYSSDEVTPEGDDRYEC